MPAIVTRSLVVGIALAVSPVAAQQPAPATFTVSSPATLLLGGLKRDLDAEFRSAGAYLNGVRLSDGRVAVIDMDRVRYFASDGREVAVAGREGAGPGEFRYLTTVCRSRGDTIVVWDDRNKRAGVLTGTGRFVRNIQLNLDFPSDGACSSTGGILLTGIGPGPGMVRRVVGTGRMIGTDSVEIGRPFTFDPGSMDATGRVPSVMLVDSTIYLAEGLRPVIGVMMLDGRRIGDIPIWRSPPRISNRDYDRLVERMVPDQPRAAAIRKQLRERRTATRWPAYGRVLADPEGCLWIEERAVIPGGDYESTGRWAGITRDGWFVGFLRLDRPMDGRTIELLRVDRGEAVLRERDTDGVVHLAFRAVKDTRGVGPPC